MANQEHLDILNQGVDAWNQWRKGHPYIPLDLSRITLEWKDLCFVNFSGVNLKYSNLNMTNLFGASLFGANLVGSDLNGSTLSNADLYGANLSGAFLNLANLNMANLRGSILRRTDLSRKNLSGTDLSGTDFSMANLEGANLSKALLINATLSYTNLCSADLSNTNLSDCNIAHANLSRAILNFAYFERTNLNETNLSNAFMLMTKFSDVDLSQVKGLESVQHRGPSTIGIDTIIASHGKISEIFLRNVGVPETIIEQIPALIGSLMPIDYYSCFISYSSKDQDFAERLYADLQAKGVRCWFAPEDMKIGDKIRPRIDESIRLYDKLLLVLSVHSVSSKWVEFEVEAAMDKEQDGKPPVLFPIRLDNAVMESSTAWAAHIKRTRHIGDFTDWKNHEDYQKAFNGLLRDLKAEVQKMGLPDATTNDG